MRWLVAIMGSRDVQFATEGTVEYTLTIILRVTDTPFQGDKIFLKEAVDEGVAAAIFEQQDITFSTLEEVGKVPGNLAVIPKQITQDKVLDAGNPTCSQPADETGWWTDDKYIEEDKTPLG